MARPSFDLLTEPWIPTLTPNGSIREVGLREALVRAHELGDVRCDSPLATVSLVRLLLAVAYRACGPTNTEAWADLWSANRFPVDQVEAYLDKWSDRFDLFSEERPFMQIAGMTMKAAGSIAQLATESSTGNNPTLFDHTCDDAPPSLTGAQSARRLVAAQAFALGFGKAASAHIHGQEFIRPYLADGICLRGVTLWLSGRNLYETLSLNLIPGRSDNVGAPSWEIDDPITSLDRVVNGKRVSASSRGVSDRYTWLSRMIYLVPEPNGTVRTAYFTQGREADKTIGDPMKVFTHSKTEGAYALGLNSGKAAWRDLASYLTFDNDLKSPIIAHAARLASDGLIPWQKTVALNVVGLATDPGKAGKFLLWRHDSMNIPAATFADDTARSRLALALSEAEYVGRELGARLRSVAWKFLPPEGNPDPKDVSKLSDAIDPRPAYWARMETHFQKFIEDLPTRGLDALEDWRRKAEQEARHAFLEACNRLGQSERSMRAIAQVWDTFSANEQEDLQRKEAAKRRSRKTKGGEEP